MRKLVAPDWDAFADYEEIVRRSYRPGRTVREAFSEQVKRQYQAYAQAAPNLEQMASVVDGDRARSNMQSCYEHDYMTDVKERIQASQRQVNESLHDFCQLCSGMHLANQWDHYLPQVLFPDFAACAYNIVYSCGACNGARNQRWIADGHRTIVHLYYDAIQDDVPYLEAEITLPDAGGAEVSFEPHLPKNGDEEFFAVYCRHFETLDLRGRFARYYRRDLARNTNLIADHWRNGLSQAKIRLSLRKAARAEPGGASSPLAALLRAAADSEDYLEYACRGAQRR